MIQRRQILAGAAISSLSLPSILHAQGAYKSEYRLSLVPGPGTAWYNSAEHFSNLVRERTQGRINIKLYPGSSLVQGAQDRELVALRQGVIDFLVGPGDNWSGTVKDLIVLSLPGLMTNDKAVDAVLASDALNKDYYDLFRRAGMEPLSSGEYGYVQLLNSKKRLARPVDAAGLKLRVVASPLQQDVMNALKANPTSMSWADAQSALASGAIDGLMLTMEQALAIKVYNLGLKHITRWNVLNTLIHFGVSNATLKAWTPDDQQIVRTAAKDAAVELTRQVRKLTASDEALKQHGVEVYAPTAAEQAEWTAAMRQPYDAWKTKTNPALVAKLEQAVAQASRS